MNMAAVASELLPRPRSRALREAALVLWLPALLPVVTGMLRDCSHCLWTYLAMLPLAPGAIVAVLLQAQDAWFVVAAAVPTALLLAGLYAAGREAPRWLLRGLQIVVVAGVAAQGVGLAQAIRM